MDWIKYIYNKLPPAQYIWRKYKAMQLERQIRKDPRVIANKSYRNEFGKDIDWENPEDLIEKIYWLQLYSDTSLWTLCADKYRVRDYVEERGIGHILNDLYGKWDTVEDINWDILPESFVLKTNNSCGQIIVVENKDQVDIKKIRKKLKEWMKVGYGHSAAQLHYLKIKPCIIAEKLLVESSSIDPDLIDYKIWCFHGKPESILVVSDRNYNGRNMSFYDLSWNNISEQSLKTNHKYFYGNDFPKPLSLNKMVEYAKVLSQEITQVRIDFYEINGKPVFGEMTFTTGFGSYNYNYYKYLGSKIDLNKAPLKP